MKSLRRCVSCILPENYPGISFDQNGVCSFCRSKKPLEYKGIKKLKEDIDAILQKFPDREYDCILGTSGGRDSTYLMYLLTQELKLKTLAFFIDHDYIPDHTRENVKAIAKKSGADIVIDKSKCLGRCFPHQYRAWKKRPTAKTISALCMGCKSTVIRSYYKVAIKHKIPVLIAGETPFEKADYKLDLMRMGNDSKIKDSYSVGYFKEILKNPSFIMDPYSLMVQYREYSTYVRPYQQRMNEKNNKTQIVPYRYYVRWNEAEIIPTIQKHFDWKNFPGMASTWRGDCYIGPIRQNLYKKFLGFNDKTTHLSELIRDGQMTRQQALDRLEEEEHLSEEVLKTCCAKSNIDYNEYIDIIKRYGREYTFHN
jgi:hypothetical protein